MEQPLASQAVASCRPAHFEGSFVLHDSKRPSEINPGVLFSTFPQEHGGFINRLNAGTATYVARIVNNNRLLMAVAAGCLGMRSLGLH